MLEKFDGKSPFWYCYRNGRQIGENYDYCKETALVLTFILRYFNFEPSFTLQWCSARDLLGSQITVTTGGFELRIS